MLGMFTEIIPSQNDVQFFTDIAPGVPWVHQGHQRWTTKMYGFGEIGYTATAWGGQFSDGLQARFVDDKGVPVENRYGWNAPPLGVLLDRKTNMDTRPLASWLFFPETAITGDMRGLGRVGADFWCAVKGKDGRRAGYVADRYPEARQTRETA